MNKIISFKLFAAFVALLFTVHSVGQDNKLCVGPYWTEDEGNLKMKEFASTWNNLASWEKRANTIKEGIIKGLKLDQMPKIEGNFNAKITNSRIFDGYIVENIVV